ncbi:MAG: DoxX family protein [Patescibacteria group bacterium]
MERFNNIGRKLSWLAPIILRLGLAVVFILFAIHKLTPASAGQGAAEIEQLFGIGRELSRPLNFYTGILEALIALALITGIQVRLAGFLAGGMITTIFVAYVNFKGLKLTPDLYRDVGLAAAGFAVFLLGNDRPTPRGR